MIRQTVHAREQAAALFDYYLEKGREPACENLLNAIAEAAARIESNPTGGAAYPRPYPGIARWGFRWIKVHRYWFGWSVARGYPVLTNVFFETALIEGRMKPDEGDALAL
jgi:hypothetical protein